MDIIDVHLVKTNFILKMVKKFHITELDIVWNSDKLKFNAFETFFWLSFRVGETFQNLVRLSLILLNLDEAQVFQAYSFRYRDVRDRDQKNYTLPGPGPEPAPKKNYRDHDRDRDQKKLVPHISIPSPIITIYK